MTDSELETLSAGIPTLKEVEEWCRARVSPVDPLAFFKFYEKRGWKTKTGESIKNWRYLEKLWEQDEYKRMSEDRERFVAKSSNPFLRYIQENEL